MADVTAPLPRKPPMPRYLSFELEPDVMEIIHRLAYETGKSKSRLVAEAIQATYGEKRSPDAPT